MSWYRRWWLLFLAWFHFSEYAVCEMSKDRGPYNDFHDWYDSDTGPFHMSEHHCSRCNTGFYI